MARHVARAGAWSAALSIALSFNVRFPAHFCDFSSVSTPSLRPSSHICIFSVIYKLFFFSPFALVCSTLARGTPWQSTWPGQAFRIESAACEVHHSHPAFQWGPGRLFHRDGARVLIDSALWKTEPLPCSLLH